MACHITQRGVNRRETFSADQDRFVYVDLLRENLRDAHVSLLGWCLMPNHVHLIAVPEHEDSLAILLRRIHGRYAQYYNARTGRMGHLWQNRYFACALGRDRLWRALAYVDRNPARADMVERASDYRWSSAAAHEWKHDGFRILGMDWWKRECPADDWAEALYVEDREGGTSLRGCTYAGRPFGDAAFVSEMSQRFERSWVRGRPKKEEREAPLGDPIRQLALF